MTKPVSLVLLLTLWASAAADDRPTVIRDVVYAQAAGEDLKADIYVPNGKGPFPGVLVVHGGAWTIGNKSHMGFASNLLAQHGYAAVTINYRLAPRHKFPAQLEDCQSAVRWLRGRADEYKIDPARVAGYGYSAGGQLVALLGTKNAAEMQASEATKSMKLCAVIAGGAPCDFREFPADDTTLAFWLGGTRMQCPETYELASPARFVTAKTPPTFLFHGEQDRIVDRVSPSAMSKLLTDHGVTTEMLWLRDKGHIETMFDTSAVKAAIGFLDRHVKREAGGQ